MTRERASLAAAAVVVAITFVLLTVLFVLMKTTGMTSASWWVVFSPLLALGFGELVLGLVIVLIALTPEEVDR